MLFYPAIHPNNIPAKVERSITYEINTKAFFVPRILLMTIMLGSDNAGPAKSNANAGPLPMPEPRSPCTIGTSVKVAKYIKAPVTEAKKLAKKPFPPTAVAIHLEGIIP